MRDKKKGGRPKRGRERKRPDVSFNFGANARPKGGKGGGTFKAKYAGGGS